MQGHYKRDTKLATWTQMHAVLSQLYVHLSTYNSPFLLGIVAVGLYAAVNFAQATLLSAKASMMARIMLTAAIYQKV